MDTEQHVQGTRWHAWLGEPPVPQGGSGRPYLLVGLDRCRMGASREADVRLVPKQDPGHDGSERTKQMLLLEPRRWPQASASGVIGWLRFCAITLEALATT